MSFRLFKTSIDNFSQEKVDRLCVIFTGHKRCVIENVLKENSGDEQSACGALLDRGGN